MATIQSFKVSRKTTEFGVVGSATTSSDPDERPSSSRVFLRFGLKKNQGRLVDQSFTAMQAREGSLKYTQRLLTNP